VTLDADRSLDEGYPRRWAAVIEVETVSGARLRRRVDHPKGDPENPLSTDELRAKFRDLAALRLDGRSIELLSARLEELTDLSSMAELLEGLRTG